MLIAVAFLSVLDVMLKLLTARYPPIEVGALRGAASLPFVVAPLLATGRLSTLRIRRWELHLVRGVLAVAMILTFTYALGSASLSNVYTLSMIAPLLVTALSVVMLREHVTVGGWVAVTIGLLGAVCVLRPSTHALPLLAALAALAAAACYAVNYVLARFMTGTETPESMVFWFLLAMAVACGLMAVPHWKPIASGDWIVIATLGLAGAIGQHFITRAFVLAPASVIAPFDYTALLWGATFDWFVWRTMAPSSTIVGAVLIVGSGLYVMLRAHGTAPSPTEPIPTALPSDPPL